MALLVEGDGDVRVEAGRDQILRRRLKEPALIYDKDGYASTIVT